MSSHRAPDDGDVQRSGDRDVAPTVSSDTWVAEVDPRSPVMAGPRPGPVGVGRASDDAGPLVMEAYDAFQRDIHAFLRGATRDAETAEDLTQETFLRLLREVRAGRTPDNVRAWLYAVAANLVTSRGRRLVVAERFKAVLADRGVGEDPAHDLVRAERRALVQRGLSRLPVDDRTALLLSTHGFSGREIAHILGRTEGATRSLLTRARIRLRERLSELDPDAGLEP
ncbi:MAG: sigma-70 family RNA polymerase sigma factor [Chloroflexota bacterium]